MLPPRFLPLVCKHIVRHRMRTGLTLAGIATAAFLFYAVRVMDAAVRTATAATAADTSLIVYRRDRYCPFSSRLPEEYARQIAALPGVRAVLPMQILVSNCRASLDVVTFRGVPPDGFADALGKDLRMLDGSLADWRRRSDAALVGDRLARRRNLRVGDRFSIAGVSVTVAGLFASPHAQDREVAYTHLDFLQRGGCNMIGHVTQFGVKVDDPRRLEAVAQAIDEHFAAAPEPTATWSEKAFAARAVADVIELVHFAVWLGWGALAAVFALVANAIVLSVKDRVREHAVLQTLGYGHGLLARLILTESALLGLLGALAGLAAGAAVLHWGRFSLATEGFSVQAIPSLGLAALGLGLCLALGLLAGLFPAWQAGRRPIVDCFRSV
jgi:putative ABC transport system permease protein